VINSFVGKLESLLLGCSILFFSLSVCLLMAVIIFREFFGISYDFLIDFVVWLTIWSLLLLSGPLYGEGGHVSIGFVLEKLSGKIRVGIEIFNALCTLCYVFVLTIGGVMMVKTFYIQGQMYPRYISIPIWIVQLCIPISFGVFTLYALDKLIKIISPQQS
jgi:C4-dicarboxylate transporter, DctQ subunit